MTDHDADYIAGLTTQQKIDYCAEIITDAFAALAEGKDDDELVFVNADIRALATLCNIDPDTLPEVEPMTAAEIRQRTRLARGRLAKDGVP